jgi:hypothetical protein
VPGGFLIAPFVTRDLRRIFLHRHGSLRERFPGGSTVDPVIEVTP